MDLQDLLLPCQDSNPDKRNQNPMCYRYTTGHYFRVQRYKI